MSTQSLYSFLTQSTIDISKFWGLFYKEKSLQRQIMFEESNQNVFLIQINASSFAEFEISEFEIARADCTQAVGVNS